MAYNPAMLARPRPWSRCRSARRRTAARCVHAGALLLSSLLPLVACRAPDTSGTSVRDPLEPVNRAVYSFNEFLDRCLWKPMAWTYRHVAPGPIRAGVGNFFSNLGTLNVAANQFLQGQVALGFQDLGRFALNTTAGLGGVLDPATDAGWPAHHADLGQTLGRWGVGEGIYLVLPVLGPTTLRGASSWPAAIALNPLTYWDDRAGQIALLLLGATDRRNRALAQTDARELEALDPYVFTREALVQLRRAQLRDQPNARSGHSGSDPELGPEASEGAEQELDDLLHALEDF